ncbi:MAG: hypothetical protein ACERKK_12055 [Poseidonibacter sp.]|uniref:hypothetical protein n=1 Tax=Poseidonibacter sp. TaxID=2321188 RepID=UPI00359EA0F4
MSRKNTSSVDTTKGEKIAKKINQNKNPIPVTFNQKATDEQIINARKAANVKLEKEKAKRRAKLAKAAKKKNKKK